MFLSMISELREETEGQLFFGAAARHYVRNDWYIWLIQKNAIWYRFPFNSLEGIQDHGQ